MNKYIISFEWDMNDKITRTVIKTCVQITNL